MPSSVLSVTLTMEWLSEMNLSTSVFAVPTATSSIQPRRRNQRWRRWAWLTPPTLLLGKGWAVLLAIKMMKHRFAKKNLSGICKTLFFPSYFYRVVIPKGMLLWKQHLAPPTPQLDIVMGAGQVEGQSPRVQKVEIVLTNNHLLIVTVAPLLSYKKYCVHI